MGVDEPYTYPYARPKAIWIKEDFTGLIKCANCGNDAPISTVSGEQYHSCFCPSCGADMRENFDYGKITG